MNIRKVKAGRNVLTNLFTNKVGVEVGVERGKFSEVILQSGAGELFCVDLWRAYGDYRQHVSDEKYEEIFQDCIRRLRRFGERVTFIQEDSISASTRFLDDSIEFIYLDANHEEEAVYNDLTAWYPKVISGGIISGHDYTGRHKSGVQAAVNRFCKEKNISELTIWEADSSASFHFFKPYAG